MCVCVFVCIYIIHTAILVKYPKAEVGYDFFPADVRSFVYANKRPSVYRQSLLLYLHCDTCRGNFVSAFLFVLIVTFDRYSF